MEYLNADSRVLTGYVFSGAFYGTGTLIVLYCLGIWIGVRERIYLHFVGYMVFATMASGGGFEFSGRFFLEPGEVAGFSAIGSFLFLAAFSRKCLSGISPHSSRWLVLGGWVVLCAGAILEWVHGDFTAPVFFQPTVLLTGLLYAWALGLRFQAGLTEKLLLEGELLRIAQELDRARRIHRALLPDSLPDQDDFRIHLRYLPMSGLGGDFYACEKVGPDSWLVLLADVSGHGLPAALDSALVRAAFVEARRSSLQPADILHSMSLFLTPHIGYRFVSAICVRIDLQASQFTLARAGHPHPLFVDQNGAVFLKPEGALLGLKDFLGFEEIVVNYDGGGRLLLYTDGLMERNPDRSQLLLQTAEQSQTGAGLVAELLKYCSLSFLDTAPEDDITMICLDLGAWATNGIAP